MTHSNGESHGRRWPLLIALLGWIGGYLVAIELGQVACYFSSYSNYQASSSPGISDFEATPKVKALARSLEGKRSAGVVGGFVAFIVTVLAIARGSRWLSPVYGLISGGVAGVIVGVVIGYG